VRRSTALAAAGVASRFCQKCCRLHARTAFDDAKRTCRLKLQQFNLLRRRGREAQHGAGDASTAETAGRVLRRGTTGSLGRWRAQQSEQKTPPPAPPALPAPPLPPLAAPWFDASDAALFGDDVISLEALLTGVTPDVATIQPQAMVARSAMQRPLPDALWMLRPAPPHFAV